MGTKGKKKLMVCRIKSLPGDLRVLRDCVRARAKERERERGGEGGKG